MPQPRAVISVPTSAEDSILSKRAFSTLRILPLSGRMAWYLRLRPCFAEPPAESPSTKNNSDKRGILLLAIRQLARQPGHVENAFAARHLARPAGGLAGPRRLDHLGGDGLGFSRVLQQKSRTVAATTDSTAGLTSDETSLSLVCEENFGSGTLTDSTAIRPFAGIVTSVGTCPCGRPWIPRCTG
jgi:hypothetical protein